MMHPDEVELERARDAASIRQQLEIERANVRELVVALELAVNALANSPPCEAVIVMNPEDTRQIGEALLACRTAFSKVINT